MNKKIHFDFFINFILFFACLDKASPYQCMKIDYFPKEEYTPDPNDSTMAIPSKFNNNNINSLNHLNNE